MTVDPFPLDHFSGVLPLFPLPNVVFFPNTLLPLHIFEPRYRTMVADALEGERLIGMVLLQSGHEKTDGVLPVHAVGCLGRILQHRRHPDGRYDIVLHGVSRFRIVRELESHPYRKAQVKLIQDPKTGAAGSELSAVQRGALQWLEQEIRRTLGKSVVLPSTLGTMIDFISFHATLSMSQKQELLEELDVHKRIEKLLQGIQKRDGRKKSARSWWNAKPSMN